MPHLIYIHGFNSSDKSQKAELVKQRCIEKNCEDAFISPLLPWQPKQAISLLEALVEKHLDAGVTLCGSSLGGYYATYLSEKYGINSVLVNPAVASYELLAQHIGDQFNPYTEEHYHLEQEHIEQLMALDVPTINSDLYWLLLQKGDEVLDYQQALKKYPNVRTILEEGGSHRFDDFERFLDDILVYAKLNSGTSF